MLNSRAELLKVGKFSARPGERVQGHLALAQMQDGTSVRIPIILLRGVEPGPVLYLQAVSDGDELNGIAVLHRFLRSLNTRALGGGIIVVPLVNFHAFHARQAHSPVDGKKLNRCFPGRTDGSSSERIAHAIFRLAVLRADLCIDLHQGGVKPMIDEVRVRTGEDHPLYEACLELAAVFGIGYILDEKGPKGQLAQVAPDHGIPTIDPELGGCHGWDDASIEKGLRGLRNVMCYYGIMNGEPSIPDDQYTVSGFLPIRPSRGGFVELRTTLYEVVRPGQELATVYNVFGEPVETLISPAEGIVWSRSLYPMAATGETVVTLGIEPRLLNSRIVAKRLSRERCPPESSA